MQINHDIKRLAFLNDLRWDLMELRPSMTITMTNIKF